MVIFRENTEDIYAGLEVQEGTPEAERLIDLPRTTSSAGTIRPDSGIGIKPISMTGSKRLIRAAIQYARRARPRDVGHAGPQGQHPEVHRGRLPHAGATSWCARSSPTWPWAGTTAAASPATRSS